jgi:hypothetical protein
MARKPVAAPGRETRKPNPDAIDPKHRWDRPIQAPGHTQVDFEERVDFHRLHDYRGGPAFRPGATSAVSGTVISWARKLAAGLLRRAA